MDDRHRRGADIFMRADAIALWLGAMSMACAAKDDATAGDTSSSTAPADSGAESSASSEGDSSTAVASSTDDGSSSSDPGSTGEESSSTADHGDTTTTEDSGSESTGAPTGPSFAEDIYPIFANSTCLGGGCHGDSPGAANLFMPDAATAYDDLVDEPALTAGFVIDRVEPGNSAASYLPMFAAAALVPAGALTNADVVAIEAWIDAGALP